MPTNEQLRRASGAAMEANRRAIGTNMEQSRRASGAAMEANRRGQQVVEDLNRITTTAPQRKTLRRVEPVGALPASRGRGSYKAPPATTGGGIASPLTENVVSSGGKLMPVREYWPAGMTSSDGLFVLPSIKTLNLTDAEGSPVQISLANPQGTVE